MINKSKAALGISLALILSGCGQSRSTADLACEAFRAWDTPAMVKEFAKLYRENPAYKELTEAALSIQRFEDRVEEYRQKVDPNFEASSNDQSSQKLRIVQADFSKERIFLPPSKTEIAQDISKIAVFCS